MNVQLQLGVLLLAGLTSLACTDDASNGSGEPFRVFRDGRRPAQFFGGPIPAATATDAGAAPTQAGSDAGASAPLLEVTGLSTFPRLVVAGQRSSKAVGRVSTNSSAVALAFDTGTGYWVLPAGDPDANNDDELIWQALCDYSPDTKPGNHQFTIAAIGGDGTFGAALVKDICVAGRTPDHLNACESTLAPPMTVVSLSWDTNVDLDLQVVPPTGDRVVSPKHPATMDYNADGSLPAEAGVIDRDSNAACAIDGIRYENLVFDKVKPDGVWGIYVNLFDACKQAAVHFSVNVYVAEPDGFNDSEQQLYRVEQVGSRQGMLLATQANGDSSAIGTYLFEVHF